MDGAAVRSVVDNPAELRYELRVDDRDEVVGLIRYRLEPGRVVLVHTDIAPAYEGRGLGSELIAAALADIRARDLRVVPQCPFVAAYVEHHPEVADLVAD
jgi:predicted GNAT family acetyltransferase